MTFLSFIDLFSSGIFTRGKFISKSLFVVVSLLLLYCLFGFRCHGVPSESFILASDNTLIFQVCDVTNVYKNPYRMYHCLALSVIANVYLIPGMLMATCSVVYIVELASAYLSYASFNTL